ncbi:MAG: hypothetical protein KDI46_00690 [Alphaproteobacteria bacterium]|nr:hypothetical protein [Alphaproteobacteria bacterium]
MSNLDAPNTAAQERGTEGDFVAMFTFGLIKPGGMPTSSDTDRVTSGPNLLGNAALHIGAFQTVATTAQGIDFGAADNTPTIEPAPKIDLPMRPSPTAGISSIA